MTCPRCGGSIDGEFYGPCQSCRDQLNEGWSLAVSLAKLGRLKFSRFWSERLPVP